MNCFYLCLLLFLLENTRYVFSSDCEDQTECTRCVTKASWTKVQNCRWCPLDRKCHGVGSGVIWGVGDNACTKHQNIMRDSDCPPPPTPRTTLYDNQLSYELLLLSSAAYYSDPDRCMERLGSDYPSSGIEKYQFYEYVAMPCDDFIFSYENCFAMLALSHQRRLITISYRGTTKFQQLLDEVLTVLGTPKILMGKGNVQRYFYRAYQKLQTCLEARVRQLLTDYPDYRVAITGHSLGGAIASIAAYQLVTQGIVPANNLLLYTYGMPRVGDKNYALEFDTIFSNSWRIVHYEDCITHLPTCAGSCTTAGADSPYHHQTEVYFSSRTMSVNDQPRICIDNEDAKCSHKVQGPIDTPSNILTGDCSKDHKSYFGIEVGTYCEDQLGRRGKRSTYDEVLLCENTCSTLVRVNGTWAHKNGAPKHCILESSKSRLNENSTKVSPPRINGSPGSINLSSIVTLILAMACSNL